MAAREGIRNGMCFCVLSARDKEINQSVKIYIKLWGIQEYKNKKEKQI